MGYLEVIAGPMYCGKTEELIRQVKRAAIAQKRVQVFKHVIDTRYGSDRKVFSHAGLSFASELVKTPKDILRRVHAKTEMVAIDESQPPRQVDLHQRLHVLFVNPAVRAARARLP